MLEFQLTGSFYLLIPGVQFNLVKGIQFNNNAYSFFDCTGDGSNVWRNQQWNIDLEKIQNTRFYACFKEEW